MTARALYCCHVVRSAGSDGNTEWRFLTSCLQVLRVLKKCLWEAFYPSKRARQRRSDVCIQNLSGFSIRFFVHTPRTM